MAQGFESHGYDLVIASNVLHATRYLEETLGHCRELLAPSGQHNRPREPRGPGLAGPHLRAVGRLVAFRRRLPSALRRGGAGRVAACALINAGFPQAEVLGLGDADATHKPDRGVIVAQGPAEVSERAGIWIVAGEGPDGRFVTELAGSNQTVVVAGDGDGDGQYVRPVSCRSRWSLDDRDSWRRLVEGLPTDVAAPGGRTPGGTHRCRHERHHRSHGRRCPPHRQQRAGHGAGPSGCRRGAGQGSVAGHPRRAGARARVGGPTGRRRPVGIRQGGRPRGRAVGRAHARPRSGRRGPRRPDLVLGS